ncbi:MAG: hypothetical protein GF411_13980 [Candidatus Lokiarchaeota archaeon]|nr:hypothetical protein [Candidatus Lokiarchaeota archaeon]
MTERKKKPPKNKKLPANYYFDNDLVERLLIEYHKTGCTDIALRDEIMSHASELIINIIRTHNLHTIYGGNDDSSFNDLFQLSWCVSPDTITYTNNGMMKIGDYVGGDVVGDCDIDVCGIDGLNQATKYVRRPPAPTLKITTKFGYNVEASHDHPFYVLTHDGPIWKTARDLEVNDKLAIQFGQNVFGDNDDIEFIPHTSGGMTNMWSPPSKFTTELAYIIGLIISEGSVDKHRIAIYNTDDEVIDTLINNSIGLNFRYSSGRTVVNSIRFVEFIRWLDVGNNSHNKHIPDKMMECSKSIIASLLRGMFDGDGHSKCSNGHVGYTSTSPLLIDQLRCVLLNFGIISKTMKSDRCTTRTPDKNGGFKPIYRLLLSTIDSEKFYRYIGFGLTRKQQNSNNLSLKPFRLLPPEVVDHIKHIKLESGHTNYFIKKNFAIEYRMINYKKRISPRVASIFLSAFDEFRDSQSYKYIVERINESQHLIWLPIKTIHESYSETVDIEVPESRSFTANGIITHNCQIESTLYKFRPGHAKVFNMWSQISRTVMLAAIKKNGRDRKNAESYRLHLDNRAIKRPALFDRFVKEAKELCKYNEEHTLILNTLIDLYKHDEKPHEGLIEKLTTKSGLSRPKIIKFIKTLRLMSFEFTDSTIGEIEHQEPVVKPTQIPWSKDDE